MENQTQVADLGRPEAGTAVAMLRRETSGVHRRLERDLGVMSPELSMTDYGSLLVGFAALHQTLDREIGTQLEAARAGTDGADLDVPAPRRTPSLRRDLDQLGLPVPPPVAFPLSSLAGALGALYVSEGAMLGGRVIAPHVRAVLGPAAPVAFFASTGTDVPARWAACRALIDATLTTRCDRTEAADVAVAVFERLAELLCR